MEDWSSDRAWKHKHYCQECGEEATCYNPACTEPEYCQACANRRESDE